MIRQERSLAVLLEAYLLANDLDPETEKWYRRVVRVFTKWHGRDVPEAMLTAEHLSRFLRDKAREGCSTHYCKSLRSGLLAVLGRAVDSRDVRSVRLEKLAPHSWSNDQVAELVAAHNQATVQPGNSASGGAKSAHTGGPPQHLCPATNCPIVQVPCSAQVNILM